MRTVAIIFTIVSFSILLLSACADSEFDPPGKQQSLVEENKSQISTEESTSAAPATTDITTTAETGTSTDKTKVEMVSDSNNPMLDDPPKKTGETSQLDEQPVADKSATEATKEDIAKQKKSVEPKN
jgi:hypothetical protein